MYGAVQTYSIKRVFLWTLHRQTELTEGGGGRLNSTSVRTGVLENKFDPLGKFCLLNNGIFTHGHPWNIIRAWASLDYFS